MQIGADEEERQLAVIRDAGGSQLHCRFNYSDQGRVIRHPSPIGGRLHVLFDSSGISPPGSCLTVDAARPETFPALAPFGVLVFKKE
jgi:hypothetical protein